MGRSATTKAKNGWVGYTCQQTMKIAQGFLKQIGPTSIRKERQDKKSRSTKGAEELCEKDDFQETPPLTVSSSSMGGPFFFYKGQKPQVSNNNINDNVTTTWLKIFGSNNNLRTAQMRVCNGARKAYLVNAISGYPLISAVCWTGPCQSRVYR